MTSPWNPSRQEDALVHKARTGGFVTGPHGHFADEATKEPAGLHEIAGERNHLGFLTLAIEDGDGDRMKMHIETNMDTLIHGWIPPRLSVNEHSCVHCSGGFSDLTRVTPEINAGGSSRFYMF